MGVRWSWTDLAALIPGWSDREISERVGVTRETVARTRAQGWMSTDKADDWSTRLGFTPHAVWEGWTDALVIQVERVCAECGGRFVPKPRQPKQRFCDPLCRQRAGNRSDRRREYQRLYQARQRQDPEVRARKIEYLRDYRRKFGERLNAQRRAQRRAEKAGAA